VLGGAWAYTRKLLHRRREIIEMLQKLKPKMLLPLALLALNANVASAQSTTGDPVDPGVRAGSAGAGGALANLSSGELAFFNSGLADFTSQEFLADGLGPRFNLDSCGVCHSQPAFGGTSPANNPLVNVPGKFPANVLPSFITAQGPIREARFRSDNAVHSLFVISGRIDDTGNATACTIAQEDFATQLQNNNLSFRIPTPLFGTGLIEEITDKALTDNLAANATQKSTLGIAGRFNHNDNDGTVTRFGWKAQNKSLLIFSGEAYNVEMGISNEGFSQERDETPSCQLAKLPNDTTTVDALTPADAISGIEKFTFFMRFLAPPAPSQIAPGGQASISSGKKIFADIGCALCHTPTLKTGNTNVVALANQSVNLYSDLALHHMGPGLADGISQGLAKGDEFRTAPLWGLGKRIFFLHDGRTSNLVETIKAHRSIGSVTTAGSEANAVINSYNGLTTTSKQDLINFLRSL
jgi:CxxC motif-containing protein (DUF1111 family)